MMKQTCCLYPKQVPLSSQGHFSVAIKFVVDAALQKEYSIRGLNVK